MKKLLSILIFLLLVGGLFSDNLEQATIVRKSEVNQHHLFFETPNGLLSVYQANPRGYYQIYVQLYSETGEPQWGEYGLTTDDNYVHHGKPFAIQTSENALIIVWIENEIGDQYPTQFYPYHSRAQKMNYNGERIWGDSGIIIPESATGDNYLKIYPDGENGFYFANSAYPYQNFNLRHIDKNGNLLNDVNLDIANGYKVLDLQTNPQKQIIVTFETNTDGWYRHYFMKIFDQFGELLSPQILVGFALDMNLFENIPIGSESVYSFSNNGWNHIEVKAVDMYGQPVMDLPYKRIYAGSFPVTAMKVTRTEDAFYVALVEEDVLKMIKVNYNGENLWQNPVIITSECNKISNIKLDINGNALISWTDDNDQLFFQSIHPDGQLHFADSEQITPSIQTIYTYPEIFRITDKTIFKTWSSCDDIHRIISLRADYSYIQNSLTALNIRKHDLYIKQQFVLNQRNYTYVVWSEFSDFGNHVENFNQIYYQIYTPEGTAVFPQGGKKLTQSACAQKIKYVKTDTDGNLLITWNEKSPVDNTFQCKFQSIGTDSHTLYGEEGLILFREIESLHTPVSMCVDQDAIYFYTQKDRNLIGQKLVNQHIVWDIEGKEILPGLFGAERSVYLLPNDTGKNYLVWRESRTNLYYCTIRTLKLNKNGEAEEGWHSEGNLIYQGTDVFPEEVEYPESQNTFNVLRFGDYHLFVFNTENPDSNFDHYKYLMEDDNGFCLYNTPMSLFSDYHLSIKNIFVNQSELTVIANYTTQIRAYKYTFNNTFVPVWDEPYPINEQVFLPAYTPFIQIRDAFLAGYSVNNFMYYHLFNPDASPLDNSVQIYTNPISLLCGPMLYKIDNNHFYTTWTNNFW
ncbi:MAG TPA: hypothetical protein PK816_11855, partial [Candidatus Cloacimonadota bacterium]|nr:hypothetical protein [Candidatus Cloacimonadota bacterium]